MEIDDLAVAVIILIRAGVSLRLAFCFLRMASSNEEASMYKKRAFNAGVFYILAESVWQMRDIVFFYYK